MRRPNPPLWLHLVTAAAILWWISDPATPAIFRIWLLMLALVALVVIWAAATHPTRSTR